MKTITEIMTRNPALCTPQTSLREVARLMVDNDCGEIPVTDSEGSKTLVGVVTDRDIVCRAVAKGQNPLELKAADCMTTPVITAKEDASLDECFDLMIEHQIRRLPIVGDNDECVGIISLADIAKVHEEESVEVLQAVSQENAAAAHLQ